ncbi:MAG: hypothetical protein H6835_10020 [Planctomycetes bacterium]|nr:hypothetical protein [Planctomycetota bacterium]
MRRILVAENAIDQGMLPRLRSPASRHATAGASQAGNRAIHDGTSPATIPAE